MIENLKFDTLRIKEIIVETPNAKTFLLEREDGKSYTYQAGQFLTLIFEDLNSESGFISRSYSICTTQEEGLGITIKKIPNGLISRRLHQEAKVGDKLKCIGVGGNFTLLTEWQSRKQIFFFAAGSGITPIFSIIKQILNTPSETQIVLIYSNRNVTDTIFYNQLLKLQISFPERLNIEWLFSNSPNLLRARLNNFLLLDLLKEYSKTAIQDLLCYACGPIEYMDMTRITLLTEGLPKDQYKQELFEIYIPEIVAAPTDQAPHQVHIKIGDALTSFTVQYPQSILNGALSHGLKLPYSCKSGQCGSCTARCISGKVFLSYNEVLTHIELEAGYILTCQGHPIEGDVTISYE